MLRPRLDAPVADEPPASDQLTGYDVLHIIHYIILLDAERDRVAWEDVAREALLIDPAKEPARARHAYETHLARAKWMANSGWKQMLHEGQSDGSGHVARK